MFGVLVKFRLCLMCFFCDYFSLVVSYVCCVFVCFDCLLMLSFVGDFALFLVSVLLFMSLRLAVDLGLLFALILLVLIFVSYFELYLVLIVCLCVYC